MADQNTEKTIAEKHLKLNYGFKRLYKHFKRAGMNIETFSFAKIKGVYNNVLDMHPINAIWKVPTPTALMQTPGTAFLVDETSLETGEEMTVGIKDGRVRTIDRFVGDGWDLKGETVGFTKFAAEDAPELRRQMDACLAEGLNKAEYEAAIIRMLKTCPGRYALVGDLPWTEIDFDADVEKARELLPEIEAVDATP